MEYNLAAIKDLIEKALIKSDFDDLVFYHFRSVYEQFTNGQTQNERIRQLLEYVQKYQEFKKLLQFIEDKNPIVYREFNSTIIQNTLNNIPHSVESISEIQSNEKSSTSDNITLALSQKEQSQQERNSLEKASRLQQSQKIESIQNAGLIEKDLSRKFQYEQQIQEEECTLNKLGHQFPSIISEPVSVPEFGSILSDTKGAATNYQLNSSHTQDFLIFSFDIITVNSQGQIANKQKGQAKYFTEELGKGITLDMIFISGGHFFMGSPDNIYSNKNEQPHHKVIIQPFFLAKHPVTQVQWKVVASFPEIEIRLNLNPSYFKGDNRPVENISWYEANEFCQRLSRYTGREYRLASEAEWEYACRAGTVTQFHFGDTLTGELANFIDSEAYKISEKGKYIGKTTPVMSFFPNSFGLYDMHGNIREWCSDYWHDNYQGAPSDGAVWKKSGNQSFRVLRGGSWLLKLENCRSAHRHKDVPSNKSQTNGFRVVCS